MAFGLSRTGMTRSTVRPPRRVESRCLGAVRFGAVSVKPSNRHTVTPSNRHNMTDLPARSFALVALLLCALAPCTARAQQPQPDVIRGHVTSDSGRIVPASVTVVRGPDRLTQQTTTDS